MTTSELQKLLESLHPLEHKVLLSFDREGALSAPDILTKSGLDESRLDMASGWLQSKGLLEVKDESVTTQVSLTETGKEYREKGTPEMRIMNALKEGRQFTVKDIIQTWGMDPSEVSSTVGSLKQASLVQIAQGGVLALTATGSVYSSYDGGIMNWQQIVSLFIVAVTIFLLARWLVRKVQQTVSGICAEDCGCSVNELVKKIPEDQLKQLREQQRRARVVRQTS